jgi:hypothetical protein
MSTFKDIEHSEPAQYTVNPNIIKEVIGMKREISCTVRICKAHIYGTRLTCLRPRSSLAGDGLRSLVHGEL